MSAVRQRASLFATRGVIVAFVASLLVFVTPRPGMSYFALGPTDQMGRANENTVDHVAAQIAAILLALMAVLGWMAWIGVTVAEAASSGTRAPRADTAQMLASGPVDFTLSSARIVGTGKSAVVSVATSPVADPGRDALGLCFFFSLDGAGVNLTEIVRLAPEHVRVAGGTGVSDAPFPEGMSGHVALAKVRWAAEERKNLEKGAPLFVITSNALALGAVRAR